MFITSDIDAADDMTNYGELGIKYKLGDINMLADSIYKLCSKTSAEDFSIHMPKALGYAEKYFDYERIGKKLAFMLGLAGGKP